MAAQIWTFFEGDWHEGPIPLMSSNTNAAWLGNTVFDGARRYDGVFPDLSLHCERVIYSAHVLGLQTDRDGAEIEGLARDGAQLFNDDVDIYIRPMFWAEDGLGRIDPASTKFALVMQEQKMPDILSGFTAHVSAFRKPLPETAPTTAKATCLYPQATLACGVANKAGFDNAVMLDAHGAVAEFSMQNFFMVADGSVHTPVQNGMLLAGITCRRAIKLLQDAGLDVIERTIMPEELEGADELVSTGNHARIFPCRQINARQVGIGPVGATLIEAYREFAHSTAQKNTKNPKP